MTRSFNTIEAATRLRVSESTIRRLFLRQQLQGVKIGRALRFTEEQILAFIERHQEQVVPEKQQISILSTSQAPKISFN